MKNNTLTFNDVILEAVGAQAEMDSIRGSVSDHLLTVAKTIKGIEPFLEKCKLAEEFIRSGKAKANQLGEKDSLPRCWTQAKSNIKKALEAGINIKQYDTESALRKKLNDVRKGVKKAQDSAIAIDSEESGAFEDAALQDEVKKLMVLIHQVAEAGGINEAIEAVHKAGEDVSAILAILVPEAPVKKEAEQPKAA